MDEARVTEFSFTKIVVDDVDAMAGFYSRVFGLHPVARVRSDIGGESIDEIMLSPDPSAAHGSLILLRFTDRPAPEPGESIVGFTTNDLPSLLDEVRRAGGRIRSDIREMPEMGIRVAFAEDPEGHLAELVQLVP